MIEDDIAAAMAEHDNEAPTADDLLAGLRSRRRSWGWIYAAAAAVLVIGVLSGVWAVAGGKPASKAAAVPPRCPAKYAEKAPWVPAKPKGIPGNSRLVPNEIPKSAVICSYEGINSGKSASHWGLAEKRLITGNLAGLRDELTWQPSVAAARQFECLLMLGRQTNYLIGLTYSGGRTMWVSTTADVGECVTGTNGRFTTPPDAAAGDAERALQSGSWPRAAPAGCNAQWGRVRAGHDNGAGWLDVVDNLWCPSPSDHRRLSGPSPATQPIAYPGMARRVRQE